MNIDIWLVLHRLGETLSAGLVLLLAVYAWPGSPLRKIIDEWIRSRVSHHFDKELESHRHELALEAERVRAQHQRLLHNAAIVTQRKHAIYRKLFHLVHVAMGGIVHLYGVRQEPSFEDYSVPDLEQYMTSRRFPGKTKAAILAEWEVDRKSAMRELRATERLADIAEAERAYSQAWNYFIGNSLYLPDRISDKTRAAFEPLAKIVAFAKFPDPGRGQQVTEWTKQATELVERLRLLLRDELH